VKTAVLLIGFGGPEKPADVRPFLESVLQGIRIPPARFEEVLRHYDVIGGISPYNTLTYRQKEALEKELAARRIVMPVFVGFRNSSPSLADALRRLKAEGVTRAVGFVLSSLRSHASFEKYVERVQEAQKETGTEDISFVYTDPFSENPLFLEAQTEEILQKTAAIPAEDLAKTFFIFSAHSIPVPMAEKSGYDRQFEKMSALIAARAKIASWSVAYQSRSGNPRDPWLEPSVEKTVEGLDRTRFKNVFLVSSGFLCDNVEVIYDLDHECRELCQKLSLGYFRARTVTDHPKFIRLVADLLQEKL